MRPGDQYLKWVEWSEEDQVYIGKCPDLITGIHGEDPQKLYAELCDIVIEVIDDFQRSNKALPASRVRPMRELA